MTAYSCPFLMLLTLIGNISHLVINVIAANIYNSRSCNAVAAILIFLLWCRHLAESYSLIHLTMARPHQPCDKFNDEFYENNGITNGADWYSVQGGMLRDYFKNINIGLLADC